jgi:hypothetical protein
MGRWPILLALVIAACGTGADPDPGVSAIVRVAGAQFVPGPPPEPTGEAPRVRTVSADTNRVFPGLRSSGLSGAVDSSGAAVLVGWEGDAGFWIIPTGVIDPNEPTWRTFGATLAFSRQTPAGRHDLVARAVDEAGTIGPPTRATYIVAAPAPSGALGISLSWDNDSDLDLHVVLPNPDPARAAMEPTIEIWSKRPSSARTAAGMMNDPALLKTAAVLDFDSNAGCVIDGRRQETLAVTETPPPGHYVVRVDAAALCGQASSRWKVTVYRNGTPAAETTGVATPADGYPAQGSGLMFGQDLRPGTAGAGQTALEFEL